MNFASNKAWINYRNVDQTKMLHRSNWQPKKQEDIISHIDTYASENYRTKKYKM